MTSRLQERPPSAPAVVTCERLGRRTCVLAVEGRFDAEAAPAFRELVREAVAGGGQDFVLDLSAVLGADTSGACALVDARRHLMPEDAEVVVAAADEHLLHLLDVVALTVVWPVEPTREAALAHLLSAAL